MSRAKPLDPACWEEHEETISTLYENNGLKEVMRIMLEEHGFEASRSQFEKQVRKWKLKKNHTKEEWSAISRNIAHNRMGKQSHVYYNGKLIATPKARRAAWRHGFISETERITQGKLIGIPPIPTGFVVRTPTPERMVQLCEEWCLKLPFSEFVDFLMQKHDHNTFVPRAGMSLNSQTLPTSDSALLNIDHALSLMGSVNLAETLQTIHRKTTAQVFSAFIPKSLLRLDLGGSKGNYNLACLSMLIFILTNGMAGLENMENEDIRSWLDVNSVQLLHRFIQTTNGWTSKELSKKFFDNAIIYDRADVVRFMITHPSFGIDVNEHICIYEGIPYTPVQLSSLMRHCSTTRVLIQNNANPNESYDLLAMGWYQSHHGALQCAFSGREDPPLDLVNLLLSSGIQVCANLMAMILQDSIPLSSQRSHLVLRLFQESTHSHDSFFRVGFFHHAISNVTEDVVEEIFKMICRISNNPDAVYDVSKTWSPVRYGGYFMTIMDRLAKRGLTSSVQQLHASGCEITKHTLIYAIQSQKMQLVRFLLRAGARVDDFVISTDLENMWHTDDEYSKSRVITPYSEAIRAGNVELCTLVIPMGALQNGDIHQLAAVLHASVETGNLQLQQDWLPSTGTSAFTYDGDPDNLDFLRGGVYHCLFDAISRNDEKIAQLAFDAWFELRSGNLPFHLSASLSDDYRAAFAFRLSLRKRDHHMTRLFLQLGEEFLRYEDRQLDVMYPLSLAVQWGDRRIIKEVLSQTEHPYYFRALPSPLAIAIGRGDVSMMKFLLGLGISGSSVDLCAAVRTGSKEIVELLLQHGTIPTAEALNNAIVMDISLVDLLLSWSVQEKLWFSSNPPSYYSPWEFSEHALCQAIQWRKVDLIKNLIQNGVGIGSSSILQAASLDDEILDLLLKDIQAMFPKGQWSAGTRALCEFIAQCDIILVRKLLAHHVDLDYFVRLSYNKEKDLVPILEQTREEKLPLCVAIENDTTHNQQILRAVLESGASRQLNDAILKIDESQEQLQETALLRAVLRQDLAVLELLIEYGADINLSATPRIRRTPLQKAAEFGAVEVVQFLLNRGADVNASPTQHSGGTALQLAAIKGYVGIIELLLKKGADISAKGALLNGRTALEGAAEHGRLDTVALLMKAGVLITKDGRRQFEKAKIFARRQHHHTVVELLESFDTASRIGSPLDHQAEDDENQDQAQTDSFMREVMNMSPTPST
ncbi:hypothetical protein F4805DRAFT_463019 [Annulohypoxylon moriforme]|nr:hypothetical protein F4805DRAFT_463019 [Annulohypoxylon moriforme]